MSNRIITSVGLILITMLGVLAVLGCDDNYMHNVQAHKITMPIFTGREALYCLDYNTEGDALILTEWWYNNGAAVASPVKHTGKYVVTPPYSVETVITSLPKD